MQQACRLFRKVRTVFEPFVQCGRKCCSTPHVCCGLHGTLHMHLLHTAHPGSENALPRVQKQHGQARCMIGDATGTLMVVAGDGAGLADAIDAGRAPVTISVWRLPVTAALDPTASPAGPSLLCSLGRPGGRSWLRGGGLAAASEPYSGWTLSVSPAGGRIAVAQPGAELLVFNLQVRTCGCYTLLKATRIILRSS